MKTDPKHEDKRVAFDRACDMLAKAADEARERERADFLIKLRDSLVGLIKIQRRNNVV